MDSSAATRMSAVSVDLPALALSLQQLPLHQRLDLEAELLQVSTPVELPAVIFAPKQEPPRTFTPPTAALKVLSTDHRAPPPTGPPPVSDSRVPLAAVAPLPGDDGDEELDQLLRLQKPAAGAGSCSTETEEAEAPERACEEVKEPVPEATEEKTEEGKHKAVTPPESCSAKQEMTEEDLEDWLDSMIS